MNIEEAKKQKSKSKSKSKSKDSRPEKLHYVAIVKEGERLVRKNLLAPTEEFVRRKFGKDLEFLRQAEEIAAEKSCSPAQAQAVVNAIATIIKNGSMVFNAKLLDKTMAANGDMVARFLLAENSHFDSDDLMRIAKELNKVDGSFRMDRHDVKHTQVILTISCENEV